jgi:hypothetical protein
MINKFLVANITVEESVAVLTQIVSIFYCIELIIRSSQYGPFCARHLSPELASGWQYASSLLFLILYLCNSQFHSIQVNNHNTIIEDRKLSMQVSNWNQDANASNSELQLLACDKKEDSQDSFSCLVRTA